MGLHSCKACQRHMRANEGTCPFCGASQESGPAARLAVGGAIVLGAMASACTPQVAYPMYGVVAPSTVPSPIASSGSASPPVAQPLYGAMAPSQPPASPEPPATGEVRPLYGAPAAPNQ